MFLFLRFSIKSSGSHVAKASASQSEGREFDSQHAEKWSIIGKRKILLWKSSWRKTNIVWNQIYCSWGKKLIFCVKWIICQQCIFLLEQEEIILTAKSRLFTLGAKGFHLPQVDLSVREWLHFWTNFVQHFFFGFFTSLTYYQVHVLYKW